MFFVKKNTTNNKTSGTATAIISHLNANIFVAKITYSKNRVEIKHKEVIIMPGSNDLTFIFIKKTPQKILKSLMI